jgi:hypothetical protein
MATIYIVPGSFAFVRHPVHRGTWLRTDVSVALVACEVCGSQLGIPCLFKSGYRQGTHYVRRDASKKVGRPRAQVTTLVIADADPPAAT